MTTADRVTAVVVTVLFGLPVVLPLMRRVVDRLCDGPLLDARIWWLTRRMARRSRRCPALGPLVAPWDRLPGQRVPAPSDLDRIVDGGGR